MSSADARSLKKLTQSVREKQVRLSELRTEIKTHGLDDFERAHRIDIVFTSNALEGNILTAGETSLVLEKGIAIGGKAIAHHLEALNHARALELIVDFAREDRKRAKIRSITEPTVRVMNYTLLDRSDYLSAYTKQAEDGTFESDVDRPPPSMVDFCSWLRGQPDTPETAFEAHIRLSGIRPFVAGNGITARLLMNYILLRAGYPAIAVRPEDRPVYFAALEAVDGDGRRAAFNALMFRRLGETLDLYLPATGQAQAFVNQQTERES